MGELLLGFTKDSPVKARGRESFDVEFGRTGYLGTDARRDRSLSVCAGFDGSIPVPTVNGLHSGPGTGG